MRISQLFKSPKRTYFLYILLGIGIFAVYFFVMVHWMDIVRVMLGQPNLGYDQQPAVLKSLNKFCGYLLWIVTGVLFVRGFIKKNLVVPISIGLGFFLSYVGVIAYLIGGPVVKDYANRIPFNAGQWQDEKMVYAANPVRIRMVDDLLKKHPLVGMNREQVDALLGVPPNTTYFSDYEYVYWLGPERGFMSIDSEWLAVKFVNGVVSEARIVRD